MMQQLDEYAGSPFSWMGISLLNMAISVIIVRKVAYTEIDWVAYMQEVEGPLLRDDWNYTNLGGDTGPLVYPAGFVYVFMLLRWMTEGGTDIRRAQYIFAVLHSLTVFLVLGCLYHDQKKTKTPFWVGLVLIFSRRIHSLFELRLFNDCVAMVFLYACIYLLVRRRFLAASLFYSAAFSIKMNIIMFAPGLAVVLLKAVGFAKLILLGGLIVGVQILLAIPFLKVNAWGYLQKSFELDRVFDYKWTVNFRYLPEHVFLRKELALSLVVCTLLCWIAFGHKHFASSNKGGLFGLLRDSILNWRLTEGVLGHTRHVLFSMFTSNFIGVVFSRSIHYQFYLWYFHSLGYLLFVSLSSRCGYVVTAILSAIFLAAIEVSYNVYPSTVASSGLLTACHAILLGLLWYSPVVSFNKSKSS